MNAVISYVSELISQTFRAVGISLMHNWKILAFAILLAVILKTYVNSEKLSAMLFKRKKISVFASVAFGAFTPLCACGTMAVIIGMLTTTFPWGPIMAFLTSSPLMSPDGFVLVSGMINVKFAVALTVASIVIGITSGFVTNVIEKRTNILKDQSRFTGKEPVPACSCSNNQAKLPDQNCTCSKSETKSIEQSCTCSKPETKSMDQSCCSGDMMSKDAPLETGCSCGTSAEGVIPLPTPTTRFMKSKYYTTDLEDKAWYKAWNKVCCCCKKKEKSLLKLVKKYKLDQFFSSLYSLGLKQILFYYTIFVAVGFMINYFIPSSIITLLFGANAFYAVPLASIIGLPLYVTTDSGIPIIQSMLANGASEGAMLAFIITGSATSAWVIAGLATFLKKRAILLYVSFVFIGGILSGYLLDFINLFL